MKKVFTYKDIKRGKPYSQYLPNNWEGTVLDLLDEKRIPFQIRLSILMSSGFVSEKIARLFAVWCARQVEYLIQDERSIHALDIAEKFANGEATQEELDAARFAAGDAAWDSALAVIRDSSRAVDMDTDWPVGARDAAHAAAHAAARDEARDAAWYAAWYAVLASALAAAWGADRDAARDAALDAQENKLREMCTSLF